MDLKRPALLSLSGYAMIWASALAIWSAVALYTGYWPPFYFFTLSFVALRMSEINAIFILAPLFSAFIFNIIFARLGERLASGLAHFHICRGRRV